MAGFQSAQSIITRSCDYCCASGNGQHSDIELLPHHVLIHSYFATNTLAFCENFTHRPLYIAVVEAVDVVLAASFSHNLRIIDFTSLLAGRTSERDPLGRGSVNSVSSLKNACDSATGCFWGYLFSRRDQNPQKPQKFCLSKISSYMVWLNLHSTYIYNYMFSALDHFFNFYWLGLHSACYKYPIATTKCDYCQQKPA